ncbi:carbamoyltransferase N-terminal domain-containing protein [Pseudomonas abietaniphila]|uniref:Carbamoyltransferase N-terminus n=1 Tax=Pseudomonas abietaniphila TaxID=89065 RepID=A0A1G8F3L0_9PSED|nr:carbamoyltransferase N-terminal domain-containing protein [Pseudomonas abietaniphila]SDH76667.1 Carbamoyltransferase N-terminus [Pseudomonas abietaniphila]
MKIFSMKPGQDGAVALIDTDTATLEWSYEAEKDSFPRYDVFNPALLMDCARQLDTLPDVVAVSGWAKGGFAANSDIGSGYYGFDGAKNISKNISFFGNTVRYFSSSHLRSHIMSAYAMSPFPQGKACYALVWEGAMGDFYLVDEEVNISHLGTVMITPGNKYGFLYALADPTFRLPKGKQRLGDAGKLMALEEAISNLEAHIPEMAAGATPVAYFRALAAGHTVLQVQGTNVPALDADGTTRIVATAKPRRKVTVGKVVKVRRLNISAWVMRPDPMAPAKARLNPIIRQTGSRL